MKKYAVVLNEHQAKVMIQALDLYSRVLAGQLEMVEEVLARTSETKLPVEEKVSPSMMTAVREAMREKLLECKKIAGWPQNGNYGINNESVDERARAAFDMIQVLRYRLSWDAAGKTPGKDPRPSIQVCYDEPFPTTQDPDKYPPVIVEPVRSKEDAER